MAERLNYWGSLMAISVIVTAAVADQDRERKTRENFVLATSCISLIIALFYTIAHFSAPMKNAFVNNMMESGVVIFLLILWTVCIGLIQDPRYEMATFMLQGGEDILYANLFLSSWAAYLVILFIVGSIFQGSHDATRAFNPKTNAWFLLLFASIVLLSVCAAVRPGICENDYSTCDPTRYGIGVGALGILFALTAIGMVITNCVSATAEIIISLFSTTLYFFGVVFLTTTEGPGTKFGNIYFATWGGAGVSFNIFFRSFSDKFSNMMGGGSASAEASNTFPESANTIPAAGDNSSVPTGVVQEDS